MTNLKIHSQGVTYFFNSPEDNISVFDGDRQENGVRVLIGAVRVATFYNCTWWRFYEPHWQTEETEKPKLKPTDREDLRVTH